MPAADPSREGSTMTPIRPALEGESARTAPAPEGRTDAAATAVGRHAPNARARTARRLGNDIARPLTATEGKDRTESARRPFVDSPGRPAAVQEVEERLGWKRLGAEQPDARPGARGDELEGEDGVDRRLPDDRLGAVLGHAPVVVDYVVQVDLARRAVLAESLHPGSGAGQAVHEMADLGRVGETSSDDVPWRDLSGADGHLLCRVESEHMDRLEHADELVAEAVFESDPVSCDPSRHEEHFFVLHIHALDWADAGREQEDLRLAERLGREPPPLLLPD